MKTKNIINVALITLGIMLIPLVLQLTIGTGVDGQGFNWKPNDFVFMGALVFITGLFVDLARRKLGKYRTLGMVVAVLGFLFVWVNVVNDFDFLERLILSLTNWVS